MVGLEYYRQSANAAWRDEQQDTSLVRLTRDMKSLRAKLDEQCDDLDELVRVVEVIEGKPINSNVPLPKIPKG